MAWHCNKCNQSGEKFDGCAISECEMVYTTGDESASNILQEYKKIVEELNWTRDLVRMAYYEGAEDNDFNRELELTHYELGKTPYTKLPEGRYTWEASNVKRLLDER